MTNRKEKQLENWTMLFLVSFWNILSKSNNKDNVALEISILASIIGLQGIKHLKGYNMNLRTWTV